MFALILGLGGTGVAMANGYEETFEDIHELLANGFVVVSLLHVAGVILHSVRHRDLIGLSMMDGKKMNIPNGQTIHGSRAMAALVFLVLIASFAGYLGRNFDGTHRTLNLFGNTLQLGESEEEEGQGQENGSESKGEEAKDDDSDDQ
jgi:cytochrome b561